jgi:iron complex transport system substrate-binding protein
LTASTFTFARSFSIKICSFLPSGTEMVYALGRAQDLVGVSHECDFPSEARQKPILVRSAVDMSAMPSADIDRTVSSYLKEGKPLYVVDQEKLRQLGPEVILTQSLCKVCAPSGPEAAQALAVVPENTRVLYLTPHTLEDVFENIRQVGEAIGALDEAKKVIYNLRNRATSVQCKTFIAKKKPKVLFLEWIDPLFNAGHWIPDMVEVAGGIVDGIAASGKDSVRIDWDQVVEFNPDVIIGSPCGSHLDRAMKDTSLLKKFPGRSKIKAFKNKRVYAVDADAYFARPGPRVVDGIELLAHLLHPDQVEWKGPADAFQKVAF